MKRSDYYTFSINGIIFLIAAGFLGGLAVAQEGWIFLILSVAFLGVGIICVMAVAESAREMHRGR